MPCLLSIETTTKVCSVAVIKDGNQLFLKETFDDNYKHAEQLHLFIQEALSAVPLTQIDAIAISKGPGSYTGLRIGVSAAKGLCFAAKKPLVSYCPLAAIQEKIRKQQPTAEAIIAFMDARRMEVYAKITEGDISTPVTALSPTPDYLNTLTASHICIGGDGAEKFADFFETDKQVTIVPNCYPSALAGGLLAEQDFIAGRVEDVAYFEPFYLKDFKTTAAKKNPLGL